jgi:hypothetical protein
LFLFPKGTDVAKSNFFRKCHKRRGYKRREENLSEAKQKRREADIREAEVPTTVISTGYKFGSATPAPFGKGGKNILFY